MELRLIRRRGPWTWTLAAASCLAAAACAGRNRLPAPPTGELGRIDRRLAQARSVARSGVPSPTPQLDSLAEALGRTTPELGIDALLATHEDRLRPGDEVQVTCLSLSELSGPRVVGQDGRVEGPVELVQATGLTAKELAARLQAQLASTYTQKGAHEVSVRLVQRAPRGVEVIGRVGAHAGATEVGSAAPMASIIPLPIDRALGVYELLSLAQGTTADADADRLLLLRHRGKTTGDAPGSPVVFHFSLRELVDAHLAGKEAWLEADDQVVVPRLPDVYVYGEVLAPGRYTWRPGLTVSSLLLVAGGATPEADAAQALLLSDDAEADAAPGDAVEPDQVLFVPQVQRIYIVGPGVANNGPLVLPATGLTAVQAISEAGWFTQFADPDGVQILRVVDGRRMTFEVPVGDILGGELDEREFLLRPGDTVVVPEGIW